MDLSRGAADGGTGLGTNRPLTGPQRAHAIRPYRAHAMRPY
jgi:hypothetical protein